MDKLSIILDSHNLRELRKQHGLTRNFVAKQLEVSPDHLSAIERGKVPLNVPKMEFLSKLYNVNYLEVALSALKTYKKHREETLC